MNTSDNDKRKHENVDQFDDLTRFLDEDFDTEDVDLFEFTTEEDSPLTQLKSIVLSLDWEITDETLQGLADEIYRLKDEEMFQADKVSQVYLQGLSKIGQYVQSEGAYAHPNAIKLLLTFYYDFEKILSSETITGTEITALLKADVRKFKILQHQIAQKHGVETPVPAAEEAKRMGLVYTDSEALRGIRAVILELDWEVTDDGLQRLTEQLDKLKEKFADDSLIQVLIQGLYSLKSYILEEKGRAHPEAYTLLHTFSEGIAKLIENKELDEDERRTIIVDQVNNLNNLKSLIAGTGAAAAELGEEQLIIEQQEEPSAETPPSLDEEEVAEEIAAYDEEGPEGDAAIAPALADEIEESKIKEEAPPEELEERLEFFFGEDEKAPAPPPEEAPHEPVAEAAEERAEPVALAGEEPSGPVTGAEEEEPEPYTGVSLDDDADIEPALAGDEAEGTEIVEETPPEELTERLEFFFGGDDEVAPFEGAEPPVAEKVEEVSRGVEEEEAEEEEEIIPALSGSPEETGYAIDKQEESPEGLAEKLEDFFGEKNEIQEAAAVTPAEEEIAGTGIEAMFEEEEEDIMPALADETGQGEITEEAPSDELTEKLEYFFGEEEVTEDREGEEEVVLTSALAEDDEKVFTEAARPMKTEEEYQAAVVQIRTHFKKLEAALREEIASLKEEVEDLRTRLKSE